MKYYFPSRRLKLSALHIGNAMFPIIEFGGGVIDDEVVSQTSPAEIGAADLKSGIEIAKTKTAPIEDIDVLLREHEGFNIFFERG